MLARQENAVDLVPVLFKFTYIVYINTESCVYCIIYKYTHTNKSETSFFFPSSTHYYYCVYLFDRTVLVHSFWGPIVKHKIYDLTCHRLKDVLSLKSSYTRSWLYTLCIFVKKKKSMAKGERSIVASTVYYHNIRYTLYDSKRQLLLFIHTEVTSYLIPTTNFILCICVYLNKVYIN